MRVMLVVDSFKGGGAEHEVLALAATLVERRHELSICFFNDGRLRAAFESLAVPLHQVSRHGWRDPLTLPRLVRAMRRFKPDIVHTHLSKSDAFGLAAAWTAGVRARIATMHNTDPWRETRAGRVASRASLRGAQRVVAVSPAVRRHLCRFSGVPERKSVVIPNTVDVTRFAALDPDARARAAGSRGRVVGIVGRLAPAKGHAAFLRAAARVRARIPDVTFEVVGEGPLLPALERQCDELGLAPHVRFSGFVDDIREVLRRFDVLAMPSVFEGLPLALLEGMAAGLPVVANRVGGIPDAVTDREHGLLVDPDDEAGLAAALLEVLQSPQKALALGRAARARVVRDFDRRVAHERVLQLYSELLSADEGS